MACSRIMQWMLLEGLQLTNKIDDDSLHLIEAVLEEVVRTLHRHQTFGSWHLLKPFDGEVVGSKFVIGTLNDQLGLVAALQRVAIKHTSGDAKTNHSLGAIIDGGNRHADVGSKGKTCYDGRCARIAPTQKLQCVAHVIHFSTSFIVGACTLSYTTEVETQGGNVE